MQVPLSRLSVYTMSLDQSSFLKKCVRVCVHTCVCVIILCKCVLRMSCVYHGIVVCILILRLPVLQLKSVGMRTHNYDHDTAYFEIKFYYSPAVED